MSVNDPMMESKHRDPMLDGIIRFGLRGLPGYPTDDVVVVVPFSDLPALLAAAREDERGKTIVSYDLMKQRKGYEQGQRDERERIRTGVTGLPWEVAISFGPIDCDYSCEEGPCACSGVMRPEGWRTGLEDVLAVIDALKGTTDD